MVASNVPGPVTTLPPTEKLPWSAMTSGFLSAFPSPLLLPSWARSSPLPPARASMDAAKARETALRYGIPFMAWSSSRVLVWAGVGEAWHHHRGIWVHAAPHDG